MSLLSFCCCQPLTSVSNQRCWCHGDLCNNPSNDTFVFSHTTTTTRATTAKTTERKTDATQEVEKTTEKQTTSKARNSRNQNFNIKKGISIFSQRLHKGAEFLHLLRISDFLRFQWQNLAEILSLLSEGQFDPI